MTHTPTPWAIEDADPNEPYRRIHGADHVETVAMDARQANAAFIVRACNAWNDPDALLARLNELSEQDEARRIAKVQA